MILPNVPKMADTSTQIDVDRVVDMGEGPETVLFLHGLFGTPEHYQQVMEQLASSYRVIAPQMPIDPQPGRRQTGMRKVGDLTDYVAELVQWFGIESLVVCGNSLGGLVAIDLCVNRPDFAQGLVLAGSAGLFERSPIRGLRSHPSREFVKSTVSGILHDEDLISEDLVDHWYDALTDRDYVRFILRVSRATRDRCVEKELCRLDLPTMIIWGSQDEITPPSTGREFQRLIKGSRLEFIDDCGHAPNWERPDAFASLLEDFLPKCFA